METITKEIDSANYLDIYDDDLTPQGKVRNGGKNTRWAARINNYTDAKNVDREFLAYPDAQLDAALINVGDILQIRHDNYISNQYRNRFETTFIVREITSNSVLMEEHKTVFSAWKTRKAELLIKKNFNV